MSDNNPNPTPTPEPTPTPAPAPDNGTGKTPQGGDPNPNPTPTPTPPNPNPEGGQGGEGGDVDYKEKFGQSTTENQRLMGVLKENGIDPETGKKISADPAPNPTPTPERNDLPQFSEEELANAFPSYPLMNPQEKEVIRNIQALPNALRMVAEMHDQHTTEKQLTELKGKEGYELIGENLEEFRTFIYEEDNLKKDLTLLADSFILKKTREAAKADPTPTEPQPEGMEGGTHGAGTIGKQSGDKLEVTTEEAARLRKEDPRRHAKLVREKKLVIVD
jgi:hypothetical protein